MLTADDFHGLYAIIPTPALPGADAWDVGPTLDVDETARVVDQLIVDGAAGIIALGTTGECPTLPNGEHETAVHTITDAASRRVPVFCGATALGWGDTHERLATVRDAGADGALLGLPMWQPLTEAMAIEWYAAASEAFPDLAVMVYANQRAFRFPYSTSVDVWGEIARHAPTVTSAKVSRADSLLELGEATDHRIAFLPSDLIVDRFWELDAAHTTACWATAASMGPWPSLAMIEAVQSGDAEAIARVGADIRWCNEPLDALISDPEVFAKFNIQIEKIRINTAGYCNAGPIRAPYATVPAEVTAAAIEAGRRWATVSERHRAIRLFSHREPPGPPQGADR